MRRKKSVLRYIGPPVLVGVVLYLAQLWPFQRTPAPPPVLIPAVTEPARDAYDALPSDFRAMVPLGEFSLMFQRMKVFEGVETPRLAEALATEPSGAEPLTAHFRVVDAADKVTGEYDFARIEGAWRLHNYTHDPRKRPSPTPAPTPTSGDTVPQKAAERRTVQAVTPPVGPVPKAAAVSPSPGSWPRSYTIQPGDRLETISRQVYGTSRYWHRILEANPGLDAKRLPIGRRLVIPAPPEHSPEHAPDPDAPPETPKH